MRAPSTERAPSSPAGDAASPSGSCRPTAAVVDLTALEHNFREVQRHSAGRRILAVVKANAYGHGAVPVSLRLLQCGADMLGVALVEEGRDLRAAGITAPILVMGAIFPHQADAVVTLGLTPVIYEPSVAQAVSDAAGRQGMIAAIHVKIDSGMGRIGIAPEDAPDLLERLRRFDHISIQGMMTHFADADLRDKQFATIQMERFERLFAALESRGISIPLRHAANSAAVLDFHRALFTMVRPGIMLYGYDPREAGSAGADLRPVLSLVTRVAYIKKVARGVPISYGRTFTTQRESLIATLPIGYADGYSRGLSNKGHALIRGTRVPVVGRVCMDMCMIDVTDLPSAHVGDEVVLIGSQGEERITADDIAAKTGTIPYEVLCGISNRVPRIYHGLA